MLNENQKKYLDVISSIMAKIVKKHNISKEYFEANFIEIYTAVHNSYQNYLKGLLTDKEFKNKLFNELWEELRNKGA